MNDLSTELLSPIDPNVPSGTDAYAQISELEGAVKPIERVVTQDGQPSVQIEPPNWNELRSQAAVILRKQSKHLRAAVVFCVASVELDQWTGLSDGLTLLADLLETFWDTLHPQLPEDHDPFERTAILEDLSQPLNAFEDPYKFLLRLQKLKLTDTYNLLEIAAAQDPQQSVWLGEGAAIPNPAQVDASWASVSQAQLEKVRTSLAAANEALQRIQNIFQAKAANATQPDLKLLSETLKKVQALAQSAGKAPIAAQSEPHATTLPALDSREQALAKLEEVRKWFDRVEPSSPVPLLLSLALNVSRQNFIQIIKRLPPDSLQALETIFAPTGEEQGLDKSKEGQK